MFLISSTEREADGEADGGSKTSEKEEEEESRTVKDRDTGGGSEYVDSEF